MNGMSNHSIKRGQSKFTCSAERENGRSKTNHKKGRPPPDGATLKNFQNGTQTRVATAKSFEK